MGTNKFSLWVAVWVMLAAAAYFIVLNNEPGPSTVSLPTRVVFDSNFTRRFEFQLPDGYAYEGELGALVRMQGPLRFTVRTLPLDHPENSFKAFHGMGMNLFRICVGEGGKSSINTVFNEDKRGGRLVYTCQKPTISEIGLIMGEQGAEPEGHSTLISWMLSVEGMGMNAQQVEKALYAEYEKINPLRVYLNPSVAGANPSIKPF